MQDTEAWHLRDEETLIAVHPKGRFKADNGLALASAALAGLGIAALPDRLGEDELESGALVRVMTGFRPRAGGFLSCGRGAPTRGAPFGSSSTCLSSVWPEFSPDPGGVRLQRIRTRPSPSRIATSTYPIPAPIRRMSKGSALAQVRV